MFLFLHLLINKIPTTITTNYYLIPTTFQEKIVSSMWQRQHKHNSHQHNLSIIYLFRTTQTPTAHKHLVNSPSPSIEWKFLRGSCLSWRGRRGATLWLAAALWGERRGVTQTCMSTTPMQPLCSVASIHYSMEELVPRVSGCKSFHTSLKTFNHLLSSIPHEFPTKKRKRKKAVG